MNVQKVISEGYCIGCGACAAIAPGRFSVGLDSNGLLQAVSTGASPADESDVDQVCPFSSASENEDQIASRFLQDAPHTDTRIGRHIECHVARSLDLDVYGKSSSGGIARWILAKLLSQGEVDAVVHVETVTRSEGNFPLFQYSIASTEAEIFSSAKSAYYPVEMSEVVRQILKSPKRFAITGVPCFIKAIRNICRINPDAASRIRYTVGIICGHQKSTAYAEMIAWQLGVGRKDLRGIDFRVKIPGKKANQKGVAAKSAIPDQATGPTTVQQLFGTSYSHGYFKYNACDYCDDVVAECADISVGDAWLPGFLDRGTSVVIVRNKKLNHILSQGRDAGELFLESITADSAAKSQAGGLRHRREGLGYRLFLKLRRGESVPTKRVAPGWSHLTLRRRLLYRMRQVLTTQSFIHFKEAQRRDDWSYFRKKMAPLNRLHSFIQGGPDAAPILPWIKRRTLGVFRRLLHSKVS